MSKKSEQTKKILDEYQMNWGFNYKQLVKDVRRCTYDYLEAYTEQFNREYNVEVIAYTELLYYISLRVQEKGYSGYSCKYKYLDQYNRDNNNCIICAIDCLIKEIANERIKEYDRQV